MKLGKVYAILVMGMFTALQIYAAVSFTELFPFTNFAMYAGRYSGENLQMLRIVCVPPPPKPEFYLAELDRFHQETDYIQLLDLDIQAQAPVVLGSLLKDLEGECLSLKLYKLNWHHFTGPVRHQPDQTELLYEAR